MRDKKGRNTFVATISRDFYPLEHYRSNNNIIRRAFISHALDSRAEDTFWHRVKIDCLLPEGANLYISYYASDGDKVTYQGKEMKIDEIVASPQVDSREKEALLAALWQEVIVNDKEFPLHKARGRFLWFKIEYISYSGEFPEITDMQVDFPLKPLTDYLPEIYQENEGSRDLLNRYLGVFQSLLDEMDDKIADISSFLDKDLVNKEFLLWLCQWLSVRSSYLWSEDKLRQVLGETYQLYQIKGTRASIERVVELYTGEKPFIVEQFEVESYQNELYQRLYGDNQYTFTVMVKEKYFPEHRHYLELKQLIDIFKPAYTVLNLVVLRPGLFLDSYVYLGVNSLLSGSSSLVLDSKAMIPFDTTLEEMEDN